MAQSEREVDWMGEDEPKEVLGLKRTTTEPGWTLEVWRLHPDLLPFLSRAFAAALASSVIIGHTNGDWDPTWEVSRAGRTLSCLGGVEGCRHHRRSQVDG